MNILNYAIRILIMAIGVVLILGVVPIPNTEPFVVQVMGAIFILWGVFRIVTYRARLKEMQEDED